MTDGKFAQVADVTGRFEGNFPTDREAWVGLRIGDVESELMGWVPSLRKTIDDITADNTAAGDTDRLNRVKRLVCDKVLDLYRNPRGTTQQTTTTPDVTLADSFGSDKTRGGDNTRGRIAFTQDELDTVRLRKQRNKFGTFQVQPGRLTHDRRNGWY